MLHKILVFLKRSSLLGQFDHALQKGLPKHLSTPDFLPFGEQFAFCDKLLLFAMTRL